MNTSVPQPTKMYEIRLVSYNIPNITALDQNLMLYGWEGKEIFFVGLITQIGLKSKILCIQTHAEHIALPHQNSYKVWFGIQRTE